MLTVIQLQTKAFLICFGFFVRLASAGRVFKPLVY
jgi:hypothetical protein